MENKLTVRLNTTLIIPKSEIINKDDIIISESKNSDPFNLLLNGFIVATVFYFPIKIKNNMHFAFRINEIFPNSTKINESKSNNNYNHITDVFYLCFEVNSINNINLEDLDGIGKHSIIISENPIRNRILIYCYGHQVGEGYPVIHHKGKIKYLGIKITNINKNVTSGERKLLKMNDLIIKPNEKEYNHFLPYNLNEPSAANIEIMNTMFELHQKYINYLSKKINTDYNLLQLEEVSNSTILKDIHQLFGTNAYKMSLIRICKGRFALPKNPILIPNKLKNDIDKNQYKIMESYFNGKDDTLIFFFILITSNKNNSLSSHKYIEKIGELWENETEKSIQISIESLNDNTKQQLQNNFKLNSKSLKVVIGESLNTDSIMIIYPHNTIQELWQY